MLFNSLPILKAINCRTANFFVLFFFVFATGCTVTYVPKPESINSGTLSGLQGAGGVSIFNAQNDTTVRELGKAGWGTMRGDLQAWTETAITLLKTEMEKAGLKTQAGAAKSLKVTIVEAELGVSGVDFVAAMAKCRVRMRVETGAGYVQEENYQDHALAPPSACDKAVSQAVQGVLSNEQIIAYLRR